jgi:hypothetical protein
MEKIEDFIKSNLPNFKLLYFFLKSEGHDYITVSFNIQSGEIDYWYDAYGRGSIKLPERLKDFYEKLVNLVMEEDFEINYDNYHTINVTYNINDNQLLIRDNEVVLVTKDTGTSEEIDSPDLLETMKNWLDKGILMMKVEFSGGGDSGYIEDYGYDEKGNNHPIPASMEDFLYNMLESNFGGWEINEGSQGQFEIYNKSSEIILSIGVNEEETETTTLWRGDVKF